MIVDGVQLVEAAHQAHAARSMQGGIIDKEMPIHVSNVAICVQGLRRDAHRLPLRRRRHEAPRLPQVRRRHLMAASDHRAAAPQGALRRRAEGRSCRPSSGSATSCRCRSSTKIVVNMGVGRATQQRSLLDGAVTDLTIITGQKPLVTKAKKSIATLQAPRGQRDRRQGDAARRPDVGVLRPAREPRDPADPRLPRHASESVRRPRQLHVRGHRAADLPRDRLRQDRHACAA